jgi:hypothetical protein
MLNTTGLEKCDQLWTAFPCYSFAARACSPRTISPSRLSISSAALKRLPFRIFCLQIQMKFSTGEKGTVGGSRFWSLVWQSCPISPAPITTPCPTNLPISRFVFLDNSTQCPCPLRYNILITHLIRVEPRTRYIHHTLSSVECTRPSLLPSVGRRAYHLTHILAECAWQPMITSPPQCSRSDLAQLRGFE